jgi:hypothetical protein
MAITAARINLDEYMKLTRREAVDITVPSLISAMRVGGGSNGATYGVMSVTPLLLFNSLSRLGHRA